MTRRTFIGTTAAAGAAVTAGMGRFSRTAEAAEAQAALKPASLGGKAAHSGGFPGWPVHDQTEEKALLDTLHTGAWFRGSGRKVAEFEAAYEKLTGAKHCIATSCGTSALTAAFGALDIGPGDEVILPPYTFVATYNAIVLNYGLPIFADVDPESFQIDAKKIDAAVSERTKAILPVHIGGSPANLDAILEVGNKHNLPVIEDACQAHLAEWRNRKVGTWGLAGCFSFQASKNLNSGEGGAVLTNDDQLAEIIYNFHNQGRGRQTTSYNFTYSGTRGSNLRLCEFQGSLLVAQMTRLREQSDRRNANALYLTSLLKEIPGIQPARLHEGATRSAWHLYMFRYKPEAFASLPRGKFIAALAKEGIPASSGYSAMNRDAYVKGLLKSKHYQRVYSRDELARFEAQCECPANEQLCQEAVWFTQNMLLGPRSDMDQIAEAIRKIQAHAGQLAKA